MLQSKVFTNERVGELIWLLPTSEPEKVKKVVNRPRRKCRHGYQVRPVPTQLSIAAITHLHTNVI